MIIFQHLKLKNGNSFKNKIFRHTVSFDGETYFYQYEIANFIDEQGDFNFNDLDWKLTRPIEILTREEVENKLRSCNGVLLDTKQKKSTDNIMAVKAHITMWETVLYFMDKFGGEI